MSDDSEDSDAEVPFVIECRLQFGNDADANGAGFLSTLPGDLAVTETVFTISEIDARLRQELFERCLDQIMGQCSAAQRRSFGSDIGQAPRIEIQYSRGTTGSGIVFLLRHLASMVALNMGLVVGVCS